VLLDHSPTKGGQGLGRSLQLDHHALGGVEHESVETDLLRQRVDKGPKTNPLHDALHRQADPLSARIRLSCRSQLSLASPGDEYRTAGLFSSL
jgi:hypothetical protein